MRDPRRISSFVENFQRFGAEDPRALYQNDSVTIGARHEQLLTVVREHAEPGDSLHDVGAGIGDLLAAIVSAEIPVSYSATELVPDVAQAFQERHPSIPLHIGDYLLHKHSPHEFVVSSGIFGNTFAEVGHSGMTAFWQAAITAMFHEATKAVSVNFVGRYRTFSSPDIYYCDPADVIDFVTRKLARYWLLDASTPLFEFTLHIFKPDYIHRRFQSPEFAKYTRHERAEPLEVAE